MTIATRAALAYLASTGCIVGLWASVFPRSFYDSFPGFGRVWVSVDGPFNAHLIRDVGAAYLMIAALSGLALARPRMIAPLPVGIATLVFNVSHFAYHASHLGMYGWVDRVLNVAVLGLAVGCSAFLAIPRARPR